MILFYRYPIWDEKKIMNTSIYDGKTVRRHCMKYELIDPLKNLRFTLVPGIKELSLVKNKGEDFESHEISQ